MRAVLFVCIKISICVKCYKNICWHASFEKKGRSWFVKRDLSAMALPHVDEIAGTDRVSDDELELLPHLPKHDGCYKLNLICADYRFFQP